MDAILEPVSVFLHENFQMVFTAILTTMLIIYYTKNAVKVPEVTCRNGKLRDFLFKHCPVLQQKYKPTIWCFEARAQTVLSSVFRKTIPLISYRREVFVLSDGGQVYLDWLDSNVKLDVPEEQRPIVILLPGLTGDSEEYYIRGLVMQSRKIGYRTVVFNNRGRGGIQLTTPRLYCANNFDDLREVVHHIHKTYPSAPLVGTGVSLGGIILGHYLVHTGKNSLLTAAMVISIVWNILDGTKSLETPFLNLMLNRHLAGLMKGLVKDYAPMFSSQVDMEKVMKSGTVREFDDNYTSKMFGFGSAERYYSASSLYDKLDQIKIPMLCLHAADDPFQPASSLPLDAARKSHNVALVVTSHGGHIGFLEGFLPFGTTYLDRLFTQYLTALMNHPDELLGHRGLQAESDSEMSSA